MKLKEIRGGKPKEGGGKHKESIGVQYEERVNKGEQEGKIEWNNEKKRKKERKKERKKQ